MSTEIRPVERQRQRNLPDSVEIPSSAPTITGNICEDSGWVLRAKELEAVAKG